MNCLKCNRPLKLISSQELNGGYQAVKEYEKCNCKMKKESSSDEIINWIESYNKSSAVYKVLIGKYPNIKYFVEKAKKQTAEAIFKEIEDYYEPCEWGQVVSVLDIEDIKKKFLNQSQDAEGRNGD